jgi:hypothetical protein
VALPHSLPCRILLGRNHTTRPVTIVVPLVPSGPSTAFAAKEVRERLIVQGLELPLGAAEEFAALIAAEYVRWGNLIRQGGIKLEN